MEAKETVMSLEKIKKVLEAEYLDGSSCYPRVSAGYIAGLVVQTQAEITWQLAFEKGRKAGLKEVVEWLSQKHFQDTHSYPDRELAPEFIRFLNPYEDGRLFWVSEEEWQTKSKELGIE